MGETNQKLFLSSISNENKDHFDLESKIAMSQNNKFDKETKNRRKSKLTRSDNNQIESFETNEDDGNFILEKFLTDAVSMKKPNSSKGSSSSIDSKLFKKPPVPLPRNTQTVLTVNQTKNNPEIASNRTYSVKNDFDLASTSSKATYNIEINELKTHDFDTKSDSSGATYNVYKTARKINSENIPIGDILIHNSPNKKSIKVIDKKRSESSNSSKASLTQRNQTNLIEIKKNLIQTINEKQTLRSKDRKHVSSDSESTIITETNLKQTRKSKDRLKYVNSESTINTEIVDSKNEQIELKDLSKKRKTRKNELEIETNLIETQEKQYTYEDFIGIDVYKTDKLLLNSLINRPCVKIHIVDCSTGEYLKKSKIVEENGLNIEFIEPLITKPYNLQEKRSLIPHWEELLIFLDDFNYLLDNSVIIFFEILDFLTFAAASSRYQKEGANSGWHKVAWAFLKPIGANHFNTEKKLRLQLYKPKKYSAKKTLKDCVLFDWWSKGNHLKYPSTLHVNIKRVKAITVQKLPDPVQIESQIDKESKKIDEKDICETKIENSHKQKNKWSRVASQLCRIPNKIDEKLKTGKKGCMVLKFSNGGLFLAYGVAEINNYPIIIYNILDKAIHCKFTGHQALIYDLSWSNEDQLLVSASGDCTVYIWDVVHKNPQPIQILPHPTFVYCARVNLKTNQILTGCYDQILRIWKPDNANFELTQELDGHTGYITSLCFAKDETVFYSSDSVGLVIEWIFSDGDWSLKRIFKFKELANTVINNIILHSGGNRLLISCRDSIHRMVDLNVGCIVQWFRGALNNRVQTTACITPCGNYLFAPSEDGTLCIWNIDTGVLQATYIPFSTISKNHDVAPHCVQYHPFEHMIAISHHGSGLPILLAIYDQIATGIELQLKNCLDINASLTNRTVTKDIKNAVKDVGKRGKKSVSLEVIIEKLDDVLVSARNKH